MRRLTALGVSLVLAAGAATGAAAWRASWDHDEGPPTTAEVAAEAPRIVSDRVDEAVAGLEADRFWAAPELTDRLSVAERTEIAQTLATAPVPTYLLYWTESTQAGYGSSQGDVADLMVARLGTSEQPARLAVVTQDRRVQLVSVGEETPYADPQLLGGRLGPGLERYAAALAEEESERPSEPDDDTAFHLVGGDYWGGLVGGSLASLLFAPGIVGGLVLLVFLVALVLRGIYPEKDS